jgi:5-methylcytosine-specific restriction endonuclease McrA
MYQDYEAKRRREKPWRAWYRTQQWRALSRAILSDPRNARCACGCQRASQVVDHVKPHRGDARLFWDTRNLQALSAHCHNSAKQRAERLGYGTEIDASTGWPRDPIHPFNLEDIPNVEAVD